MRIIRHIFYEEGEMIMLSIKHLTKIYSGNKKAVDDRFCCKLENHII